MKESRSEFLDVRGLRYHCRIWGEPGMPMLFLLHGFQDVSASWQFTVDAFKHDWHIIAPDWRGYGLTQWTGSDAYWFADLLGDLDYLIDHYYPDDKVRLVGHSMGAQVAGLYAGVQPERVRSYINIDGFGPPGGRQDPAPRRIAKWLAQLHEDTSQRPYYDFEEFALRMCSENPRLTEERARFIVQHWGQQLPEGGVQRRADPAHKRINPVPLTQDEILECWRQSSAPVLWIDGTESGLWGRLTMNPKVFEDRKGCYQDLTIEHVEEAGHNVHHDQPERLAATIEKWLKGG